MTGRRDFLQNLSAALGALGTGALAANWGGPGRPPSTETGFRNVREFGAVGDGSTDDTEAFNEALATGAPLLVPAGSYAVRSPLRALRSWALVQGIGPQSRINYTGEDYLFRTSRGSQCVQLRGLSIRLYAPDSGAVLIRNSHYARLSDLWIFGTAHNGVKGQIGICIDSASGGYWTQGGQIFLRRLSEGFRLTNRANASTWVNVTIRDTILPVNIQSGYGFQLIGGFIEGWGGSKEGRIPAIFAGDRSGVILGVVFEEVSPGAHVVEFANGATGWFILGRFNVAGGVSYGEGGDNATFNTSNLRYDNMLLRRGGVRRPPRPDRFDVYFDQELGKPIWWDGTRWVDAMGQPV